MPYKELYRARAYHLGKMLAMYHPTCSVGPVIDGKLVQGFPTTYDYKGFDKPFIMGNTVNEGWQQKLDYDWGNSREDAEKWITRAVQHLKSPLRERMWSYYMGMPEGSPQAMTDIMYTIPKIRVAEKAGKQAPAFIYRYDYRTKGLEESGYHACHGIETWALFDNKDDRVRCPYADLVRDCEAELDALGDNMARHWGVFAATGDPSLPGEPWPAYTPDTRLTFIFDKENRVESDPEWAVRKLYEGVEKLTRD